MTDRLIIMYEQGACVPQPCTAHPPGSVPLPPPTPQSYPAPKLPSALIYWKSWHRVALTCTLGLGHVSTLGVTPAHNCQAVHGAKPCYCDLWGCVHVGGESGISRLRLPSSSLWTCPQTGDIHRAVTGTGIQKWKYR